MNKNTPKAYSLSAIAAFIVVGGVAHANWQETPIQPTLQPISVPVATAQTQKQGNSYDVQYTSGSTTNATRQFEWVEDGESLIPIPTRVRLHATATWPHPVTVDPTTPGIDLDHATALLMMSDPHQLSTQVFQAEVLEYDWFYNSQQHKVVPFPEPDPSSLFCEKDGDLSSIPRPDGGYDTFLTASFDLDTTAKAEVMSGTTTDWNSGQTVNTFAAKATSGASTITPTSFEIVVNPTF